MAVKFDLVIKNGRIIDGSGNPYYYADIGISGEQIVAISRKSNDMEANRVIDVPGMVVSPGFIDAHSHDDAYIIIDPHCSQKLLQGVTTDVIGNCGFSMAPLSDAHLSVFRDEPRILGLF